MNLFLIIIFLAEKIYRQFRNRSLKEKDPFVIPWAGNRAIIDAYKKGIRYRTTPRLQTISWKQHTMARLTKLFPALLLLLLVASEMGPAPVALGELCEIICGDCKQPCSGDDACTPTCRKMGFDEGVCRGPDHPLCICIKNC
ncbi:hypothetical protein ACP4OV_006830 [Aristida adscensionis]